MELLEIQDLGKSIIAEIISKKINAYIIDADKIAKKMFAKQNEYYQKIEEEFGKDITRKELANTVYHNKEKREKLNDLTKKYVVDEIINIINNNKGKTLILDVPLLFESNLNDYCDKTIGVIAEEKIKLGRIIERDNISEEEAIARLNIQKSDEYYKTKADYIITNNGEDLDRQILEIIEELNKK